ncbi:unnamed protein product [Didymodactylos carnosus]|uniref:Uncharacterized protein n=1 Tax=Didymodactylos carnosus TaxID=1234261 RepID=A0A8S2EY89_9BILA|nr:unnamed protein product [Didymodactylos carnosus]CAF4076154.1 unnamed protein product [Didymodactylos carnosus]
MSIHTPYDEINFMNYSSSAQRAILDGIQDEIQKAGDEMSEMMAAHSPNTNLEPHLLLKAIQVGQLYIKHLKLSQLMTQEK